MKMNMKFVIAVTALASGVVNAQNTAYGDHAFSLDVSGTFDSAFGWYALAKNTTGNYNTAIGTQSLDNNNGNGNSAIGQSSLFSNTTGGYNTAQGFDAMFDNTTGQNNTALGSSALYANTSGIYNTAVGIQALNNNYSGSYNIGIGWNAGYLTTTGNYNIEIGNNGQSTDTGVIRIGNFLQHYTAIAGISGTRVTGAQVLVNGKGQLGVATSSIRYKQNVNPMGDASDKVLALRPVTFQYKEAEEDGSKPIQYGLIAEEVEKVMPDLVVYNDKGQPETVAYQTLAPLLLNELQKEHKQIERMQAEIDELRKAH